MAIAATLNQPLKLQVAFTLAGAAGSVDSSNPIVWALEPAANGTITPAADGLTADVVLAVIGDTTVSVTADANLAAGVLDLIGTELLQAVEVIEIGADAAVITAV